jgi:hypothetical protein
MWGKLAGLVTRRNGHTTGDALAGCVGVRTPEGGGNPTLARVVFATHPEWRHDPILAHRTEYRLNEMLHRGGEPWDDTERAALEAVCRDFPGDLGVAHRLPPGYADPLGLWTADVAVTPEVYAAGHTQNEHDACLFRVRFDLAGPRPTAGLVPAATDMEATARRRLDGLLARGAKFVWAEVVQANYRLYQDNNESAPALVMFSFDYTVPAEEIRALSERLHPLRFTEPADPVLRQALCHLETNNDAWYYHRRWRVPPELFGGRVVYTADLWVHRPFIAGRFPHRDELGGRPRRVPCLAEPWETGWAGIELVPVGEVDEYRRRAAGRR